MLRRLLHLAVAVLLLGQSHAQTLEEKEALFLQSLDSEPTGCSDAACNLCVTSGWCKKANDGPGPGSCTWYPIDTHPDGLEKGGHRHGGICIPSKYASNPHHNSIPGVFLTEYVRSQTRRAMSSESA